MVATAELELIAIPGVTAATDGGVRRGVKVGRCNMDPDWLGPEARAAASTGKFAGDTRVCAPKSR
jgi:hypothetical protein